MSESIILYLADPSSYRYLHHIQDVGQTREPLQMPLERWEAGMQQPPDAPVHPRRLCLTGAAVASSLAQPYLLHISFSPCCKLSSEAERHLP